MLSCFEANNDKQMKRNSRVIGETIAGRRATAGRALAVVAAVVPLLLLIDDDTSMKVVSHTGQGPFQAVHWALLLLDLLVQQRTATVLAVGVDAVVIIVHFIIRPQLLEVLLLFRRRQRIRQSQSGP